MVVTSFKRKDETTMPRKLFMGMLAAFVAAALGTAPAPAVADTLTLAVEGVPLEVGSEVNGVEESGFEFKTAGGPVYCPVGAEFSGEVTENETESPAIEIIGSDFPAPCQGPWTFPLFVEVTNFDTTAPIELFPDGTAEFPIVFDMGISWNQGEWYYPCVAESDEDWKEKEVNWTPASGSGSEGAKLSFKHHLNIQGAGCISSAQMIVNGFELVNEEGQPVQVMVE